MAVRGFCDAGIVELKFILWLFRECETLPCEVRISMISSLRRSTY